MAQPESFGLINLLELSEVGQEQFEARVTQSNGRVRVWIHPLVQINHPDDPYPASDEYKKLLREQLLVPTSDDGVLPIIFQDRRYWHDLENIAHFRRKLWYAVPTMDANPTPFFKDTPEPESWEQLVTMLAESEVEGIELAGRYLLFREIDSEDKEDRNLTQDIILPRISANKYALEIIESGLIPYGCVGLASWIFLIPGFDVSISPATSPTNRVESTEQYSATII
jgi:hypothetical protein